MGQYRALLIGASDYKMRGVQTLPFIANDLERLSYAFERHGFGEIQVLPEQGSREQVTLNYVKDRVTGFLKAARRGDILVILLSGHGVHANGKDYLVPEDIYENIYPFESGCVEIGWQRDLDETLASHIVILIDACREGIEQDSKGVSGIKEWGRQKVDAALVRKVAYVYACSPAQLSLFVRSEERALDGADCGTVAGESFSIFSRAVSDVIVDNPGALTLDNFQKAVQNRVTELHRAYRKMGSPQRLRIVTDILHDEFIFLPKVAATLGRVCDTRDTPPGIPEAEFRLSTPLASPGKYVQYKRLSGTAHAHAIEFSPDSRWLATAVRGGGRMWSIDDGKCFREIRQSGLTSWMKRVTSIDFSPDGQRIATGSRDGSARIWDNATGRQLVKLDHDAEVTSVDFSPDGQHIATGSRDGSARIWDAVNDWASRLIYHGQRSVLSITFSPQGHWLGAGVGSQVIIWNSKTGDIVHELDRTWRVTEVLFSSAGLVLAVDGLYISIFDLSSWRLLLKLGADYGEHAAFSPDGSMMAYSRGDKVEILKIVAE